VFIRREKFTESFARATTTFVTAGLRALSPTDVYAGPMVVDVRKDARLRGDRDGRAVVR
jgi:hypothetical protein